MPMGRVDPRPDSEGAFPLARRWVPVVFGAPFHYELWVLRREFRDFPPSLVRMNECDAFFFCFYSEFR